MLCPPWNAPICSLKLIPTLAGISPRLCKRRPGCGPPQLNSGSNNRLLITAKRPRSLKIFSAEFVKTPLPPNTDYRDEKFPAEIVLERVRHPPPCGVRMYTATVSGPASDMTPNFCGARCMLTRTPEGAPDHIDEDVAADLRASRVFLWFYGHIVYDTLFQKGRETRFCWRYDGRTNAFERYGEEQNRRTSARTARYSLHRRLPKSELGSRNSDADASARRQISVGGGCCIRPRNLAINSREAMPNVVG